MQIIQSTKIKKDLMKYCLYERGHSAVVTESINNGDVVSISGSLFLYEFEIKISRADLKRELDAVEFCLLELRGEPYASEQMQLLAVNARRKAHKHREYLNPESYFKKRSTSGNYYNFTVPNYFYFFIPENLIDYCQSRIENTKFGIMTKACRQKYRGYGNHICGEYCRTEVAVIKKAKRLHSNYVSRGDIMRVLTRMSYENVAMLDKIVAQDEKLKSIEQP